MTRLLRRLFRRVDVAQRLTPVQPFTQYEPPTCAKYLTKQERAFVDELCRLLTQ